MYTAPGVCMSQRFVRTLLVVLATKTIKSPLLRAPVAPLAAKLSPASACDACARASVLFRMSGRDALRHNPQLHPPHRQARKPRHRARRKRRAVIGANRLWHAALAKRRLEDRSPTRALSVFSTCWQRNKYRLQASVIVNGSMRAPSCVLNHPLKSAHHTRLGASAAANGCVYGGARRRFLRATTKPSRASIAPMVLAAGHSLRGISRSNTRFNLRGPQLMCFAPQLQHRLLDFFRRLVGMPPRCPVPILQRLQPSLLVPPQPVVAGLPRDVVHLAQSLMVYKPSSCSNTNRIRSSITLLAFQGIWLFYTPVLAVSGMSPVRSVRHVSGLHHKLAQRVSAG